MLSKSSNKCINNYIKDFSKSFCDSAEDLKEMQEELRNHIIDRTEELMAENMSEEDALKIAIDDFGDIETIRSQSSLIVQNVEYKLIFKMAAMMFCLSYLLSLTSHALVITFNSNTINQYYFIIKAINHSSIILSIISCLSLFGWQAANLFKTKGKFQVLKYMIIDVLMVLILMSYVITYFGLGLSLDRYVFVVYNLSSIIIISLFVRKFNIIQ